MREMLTVAVVAILLSAPVEAADKFGRYKTMGLGKVSCTEFLQHEKENRWLAKLMTSWSLGYLTAVNQIQEGTINIIGLTDEDGVSEWINKYCREHRYSNYSDALTALITEFYPFRIK